MSDASPLTAYRAKRGESLEELGRRLGVHKTTVLRWEAGRVPAERVADVCKITGLRKADIRPDLFGSRTRGGAQ